jgi:hypothetical protein
MFSAGIRNQGRVATRHSWERVRRGAFVILPLFLLACVSAPPEIVRTLDAGLASAERFRSYSVMVQDAYRRDLGEAWSRERAHILRAELEKKKDAEGRVEVGAVEELLGLQAAAAKRHASQLEELKKRDEKAGRNWLAFKRASEALRRYLASGMSAQERAELFEVIAGEAERLTNER